MYGVTFYWKLLLPFRLKSAKQRFYLEYLFSSDNEGFATYVHFNVDVHDLMQYIMQQTTYGKKFEC